MIESWHLFLTGIGTCVIVFAFIWNFNRARKNDFKEAMSKKADAKTVRKDFEIRDVKISNIENHLAEQNKNISDKLEEHYSILETVQANVLELIKKTG